MAWLLEDPIPVLLIGGLLVGALGLMGWSSQNRFILAGAVLCLVATLGVLWIEQVVITPKEEIESTLQVIAADLESNDAAKISAHFAATRDDLAKAAVMQLKTVTFETVSVKSNLEVHFHDPQQEHAEARFNATARLSVRVGELPGQMIARYFIVQFDKVDGRWLVSDYDHRDPREGI